MAKYLHAVLGANDRAFKIALGGMSFALNGASPPDNTKFGGQVAAVRRLESGGTPFFRVTPIGTWRMEDVFSQVTLSADPASDAPVFVHKMTDLLTPAPADTRATNEFDIAVYNLAGTRIDTADIRVNISVVTRG